MGHFLPHLGEAISMDTETQQLRLLPCVQHIKQPSKYTEAKGLLSSFLAWYIKKIASRLALYHNSYTYFLMVKMN